MTIVTTEYHPDGTVRWQRLATDHVVNEEIARQAVLWAPAQRPALSWRFVDIKQVPADRTFRDAWRLTTDGAPITVDMPAARELHRAKLRRIRVPLLEALDVEYMRADERGNPIEKADITARKQALRDVTADPAIEAATTPEELKAVRPAALG